MMGLVLLVLLKRIALAWSRMGCF